MNENSRISLYNDYPEPSDTKYEVLKGLQQQQKTLPAKYFYDEYGSRLFEKITELPEYYPTRTEISLLRQHAGNISEIVGQGARLIEFGSGASIKIRILLEALKPSCYVPMDISSDFLVYSAEQLAHDFPWLDIQAACIDYSQEFDLPSTIVNTDDQLLGFFPGSSIGNFTPQEAGLFLRRVHNVLGRNRYLLLGIDLDKDQHTLQAAYDDSQGITALFNKNILNNINKHLDSNFDTDNFNHKIILNKEESRVEMHLESRIDQVLKISENRFTLKKGETIHTENSHKYTIKSFEKLSKNNHFDLVQHWQDENHLFAIVLLQAV